MMFGLKVKGKMISLFLSLSLGKSLSMEHLIILIDILENFMLQLNGSRHGTLDAARLDKFKKSTDNDLRQARKHYANIFIVFFIKLGICGDSV